MSSASIQAHTQAGPPPAVSHSLWSGPIYDSDDDLSDAPESPILPPSSSQTSSNHPPIPRPSSHPPTPPPSDSSSDLSDAPENPIWPGNTKAPSTSPRCREKDSPVLAPPKPPRCKEKDCPVAKAVHRHYQGRYLHNEKPPRTNKTIFSDSNPPPHIWKSWKKIQARDGSSTVEDDWRVLGFLRWHVDDPNTSRMVI